MYDLYIANKNYSSWSLRPWALMRELKIDFREHCCPSGRKRVGWISKDFSQRQSSMPDRRRDVVWDSLAIVEYLAERHDGVWPKDAVARAWARSAAAEMHSGFGELRNRCSMSCGIRVRLNEYPAALERDTARLGALWSDGCADSAGRFSPGRHLPRSTPSSHRWRSGSSPTA